MREQSAGWHRLLGAPGGCALSHQVIKALPARTRWSDPAMLSIGVAPRRSPQTAPTVCRTNGGACWSCRVPSRIVHGVLYCHAKASHSGRSDRVSESEDPLTAWCNKKQASRQGMGGVDRDQLHKRGRRFGVLFAVARFPFQ